MKSTSLDRSVNEVRRHYFDGRRSGASRDYWCFVAATFLIFVISYSTILLECTSFFSVLVSYVVAYTSTSILAISLGHQAFHGSLGMSRRITQLIGVLSFVPLGVDGVLWRQRHIVDHHPHPNARGHDGDLDNPLFFRLAPYTERRWYHRYQHLYAAPLYSIGVLVTVFLEDFRLIAKQVTLLGNRRQKVTFAVLAFARKVAFIGIWFCIPLMINRQFPFFEIAIAFGVATIPTAWLFLPIAAAHLNEYTAFFENAGEQRFSERQFRTTVDFCRSNRLATMVYGGLNFHLAHHLWPKVACCHYEKLHDELSRKLARGTIPPSCSLWQLFTSHYRFLRALGAGNDLREFRDRH